MAGDKVGGGQAALSLMEKGTSNLEVGVEADEIVVMGPPSYSHIVSRWLFLILL